MARFRYRPIRPQAILLCAASWALCTFGQETARTAGQGVPDTGEPTAELRHVPGRATILMGLPGDSERLPQYRVTVERLINALAAWGVPNDAIMVLFGDGSESMYPACTAESLAHELGGVAKACRAGGHVWLFLVGHSNSTEDDVFFNIAGPDVTAVDLAKHLRRAKAPGTLVVFLTTAGGGKYVADLAGAGRILVSATSPDEEDNEALFPHALAHTLAAGAGDTDGDGFLSVLEVYRETVRRVEEMYDELGFVVTERALLDGDGDGHGTARPAPADADAADRAGLWLKPPASENDVPETNAPGKEQPDHDDGDTPER